MACKLYLIDFDNNMYFSCQKLHNHIVHVWVSVLEELGQYSSYEKAKADVFAAYKKNFTCFVPGIDENVYFHHVNERIMAENLLEKFVTPCLETQKLFQYLTSYPNIKVAIISHSSTAYVLKYMQFLGFLPFVREKDIWGLDRFSQGVKPEYLKSNFLPWKTVADSFGENFSEIICVEDSHEQLIPVHNANLGPSVKTPHRCVHVLNNQGFNLEEGVPQGEHIHNQHQTFKAFLEKELCLLNVAA